MHKVYWKTLKVVLLGAHTYATRWQHQLQATISPEAYDCLVTTIQAIITCVNLLPTDEPT